MAGVLIIAEAGVNHNGQLDLAYQLVDAAAGAGVDIVKFQTFKAESLVTRAARKAEYQEKNEGTSETQFNMLKRLELSEDDHHHLLDYCRGKGITFLSSAFDPEGLAFLDRLGLEYVKIPSGEITNRPYLACAGRLGKKVLMSTGMADLREVEAALDVLVEAGTPKERITVLQCNTEYPTPFEDVNLNAMLTMREALGVSVGYSDHTLGIEAPVAAVALGAVVIEKHLTLDRGLPGPDHRASLEADELQAMVRAIRNIEQSLGNGIKRPSPSEKKNLPVARKSIVAACPIRKGEVFTEENLTVKRPGTDLNPMQWHEVLGQEAAMDFAPDEPIRLKIM